MADGLMDEKPIEQVSRLGTDPSQLQTVELSADGTKAAEEAWDELFDAAAWAGERGMTWLDVDGEHKAAVVSPAFGLFIELLMRKDTSLHATLIHPNGTRQELSGVMTHDAAEIVNRMPCGCILDGNLAIKEACDEHPWPVGTKCAIGMHGIIEAPVTP